jgi:uncharacterized membrane protein YqgA involved in biofilm formation
MAILIKRAHAIIIIAILAMLALGVLAFGESISVENRRLDKAVVKATDTELIKLIENQKESNKKKYIAISAIFCASVLLAAYSYMRVPPAAKEDAKWLSVKFY